MGKKTKKDKKGKGAEKTAKKTEKKLQKKVTKNLEVAGEENLELLIAKFREEDKKKVAVKEIVTSPPSPRVNFSFVANPDKEEIYLFGGQYYDGRKIYSYNHLYVYNANRNEWSLIEAPNAPPPRCGHQTVLLKQAPPGGSGSGVMWVFGGEFASPTQTQFYHYRDLWSYTIKEKKWELVSDKTGPSPRSGHRMVAWKRYLILFGGFQDTGSKTKYLNDLWQFDSESRQWSTLKPTGDHCPSPRSGCLLFTSTNLRHLYLVGGYSKEKVRRDDEKGVVHSDFYQLTLISKAAGNSDSQPQPAWVQLKPCGARPSPRCSMSGVSGGGTGCSFVFGGVWDVESPDGEQVRSAFYADLYTVELERAKWHPVRYNCPTGGDGAEGQGRRRRRRRKDKMAAAATNDDEVGEEEEDDDDDSAASDSEATEAVRNQTEVNDAGCEIGQLSLTGQQTSVFTVRMETTAATAESGGQSRGQGEDPNPNIPSPRINAGLALIGSRLYLYGGSYEVGDRQVTLDDLHTIDTGKMDSWQCLCTGTAHEQAWLGSDAESMDEEDEEMEVDRVNTPRTPVETSQATGTATPAVNVAAATAVEQESSDDDDDEELCKDAPVPVPGELFSAYWTRTQDFWFDLLRCALADDDEEEEESSGASDGEEHQKQQPSQTAIDPVVRKYAMQSARDFYREQKRSG